MLTTESLRHVLFTLRHAEGSRISVQRGRRSVFFTISYFYIPMLIYLCRTYPDSGFPSVTYVMQIVDRARKPLSLSDTSLLLLQVFVRLSFNSDPGVIGRSILRVATPVHPLVSFGHCRQSQAALSLTPDPPVVLVENSPEV